MRIKKRITMCLQMKTKIRKNYRLRIKQYARDRVTKFKKGKFTKGKRR